MVLTTENFLLSDQRFPRGAPGTYVDCNAVGKGSFLKNLDQKRQHRVIAFSMLSLWNVSTLLMSEIVRFHQDRRPPQPMSRTAGSVLRPRSYHHLKLQVWFFTQRTNSCLKPFPCSISSLVQRVPSWGWGSWWARCELHGRGRVETAAAHHTHWRNFPWRHHFRHC